MSTRSARSARRTITWWSSSTRGESVPYFFVQVKATRKGLTKKERRLVVEVDEGDVLRMVRCPVPTYLVGVDEPGGRAYVASVHGGMTGPLASIPSKYPLNRTNLKRLWVEVRAYWQTLDPSAKTSAFAF